MVATIFVRRGTPPRYWPVGGGRGCEDARMELLVIRHALPVRIEGVDGPADPPLSDLGLRQAEALAEWLAPAAGAPSAPGGDTPPITAIVTSPLRRAVETAAPLAARLGIEPAIEEGVVEWDRHAATYVPMEEMQAEDHPEWRAMVEGRWHELGVDVFGFRDGVAAAFERIIAAHPGARVAVVCHGGVINALASHVIGLADPVFFEPTYTGVTRVLASRDGHRMLASLNETGHLRGVGVYEPSSGDSSSSRASGTA